MAIIISGALKAAPALATVEAERRVAIATHITLDETGLALAIIALRQVRVLAVDVVHAAHTIGAVITDHTEGRELKAARVIRRIAGPTRPVHADAIKAVAIIITHALRAAHAAVGCHHTERRVDPAARVVPRITGHALIG